MLCRQISPVIPHNYKDSSLPASVFVFQVINNSDRDLEASIAFTFRNGSGDSKVDKSARCTSEAFRRDNGVFGFWQKKVHNSVSVLGVRLDHSVDDMACTYGLAVVTGDNMQGSVCTSFKPTGTGENLWRSLAENGELCEEGELSNRRRGSSVRAAI